MSDPKRFVLTLPKKKSTVAEAQLDALTADFSSLQVEPPPLAKDLCFPSLLEGQAWKACSNPVSRRPCFNQLWEYQGTKGLDNGLQYFATLPPMETVYEFTLFNPSRRNGKVVLSTGVYQKYPPDASSEVKQQMDLAAADLKSRCADLFCVVSADGHGFCSFPRATSPVTLDTSAKVLAFVGQSFFESTRVVCGGAPLPWYRDDYFQTTIVRVGNSATYVLKHTFIKSIAFTDLTIASAEEYQGWGRVVVPLWLEEKKKQGQKKWVPRGSFCWLAFFYFFEYGWKRAF